MKKYRKFAVSSLTPSVGALPQTTCPFFLLHCTEPKRVSVRWATFWYVGMEVGVGVMRVVRPSFGCLISFIIHLLIENEVHILTIKIFFS